MLRVFESNRSRRMPALVEVARFSARHSPGLREAIVAPAPDAPIGPGGARGEVERRNLNDLAARSGAAQHRVLVREWIDLAAARGRERAGDENERGGTEGAAKRHFQVKPPTGA
jgi:hypothetical protein